MRSNSTSAAVVQNSTVLSEKKDLAEAKTALISESKKLSTGRKGKSTQDAMYVGAIYHELTNKSPQVAEKFSNIFQQKLLDNQGIGIKAAAHSTLNELTRTGDLVSGEAKKLTSDAWRLVFKEIPKLEKEIAKVQPDIKARSASSKSAEVSSDLPAGFLWKPVSDSAPHALAVLLPPDWTGNLAGLDILDPASGEVLAKGRDGGVGNGDRQHYRFDRPGADFPDGALVRVKFKDGSERLLQVKNTANRTEGR